MDSKTNRLLETDYIDWTPEKLARRIQETRDLINRLDTQKVEDRDFVWIREQLVADLARKEVMLEELEAA